VKLTQQKSITKTNSHAETTLSLNFDSWIGSFLQYTAHLQRHKIQNAISISGRTVSITATRYVITLAKTQNTNAT